MNGYKKMIQEVTGCNDNEVDEIEDIMRHDIFHSTLDWITKAQFNRGARKAYKVMKAMSTKKE